MKVGKSAETYQVGVHFKALIKAILVAPSRTLEKFFSFRVSLPRCEASSADSGDCPSMNSFSKQVMYHNVQEASFGT